MEIILLDELSFDNFANLHPAYCYYQTSAYGSLMGKNGFNPYYIGLKENGTIIAATLIMAKMERGKSKMGYCPRGFLIDWNDYELVKTFTELIKAFLSKRGFIYLKIDPFIIYKEHNRKGEYLPNSFSNEDFVKNLQDLGYIHLGYNNGFEAQKHRWNAINRINTNTKLMYNEFDKSTRDKIVTSVKDGCKVYRGNINDLNILYSLIDDKNKPPIDYYLDYYEFFSPNNGFELYFTKLESIDYVNSSKILYEKEEEKNNELNLKIQNIDEDNKEQLINEKMKSDELIGIYKKNMLIAINLFQNYPSGIIIAGAALIKHKDVITFIANGYNKDFEDHFPNYLLNWSILQDAAAKGFKTVDFNGIHGDFINIQEPLKIDFANVIVEYVGEFDLVIDKKAYYTNKSINPILNWLNTPI
ncbi:MAG: peptidoglycan bridge formation glycyltransferase FemA/FemB family protein [Bacilli bacterium]